MTSLYWYYCTNFQMIGQSGRYGPPDATNAYFRKMWLLHLIYFWLMLQNSAIFRFLPSFYTSQCLLLKILIWLPRYMIIYKPLKFKHKDKLFRKADKKLISFNKQHKMALFQLVFAIYYNGCLTSREIWICWLPILCYC